MNGAERCLYRSIVMVLSLLVLPLSARADELMKWERIPLPVTLMAGQERVIFADKNVRVGFPPALNGKLRVQSTGGAVYLKAESVFPQTRLQLQDVESGEIILLDVTAAEKGPQSPYGLCMREASVRSVRLAQRRLHALQNTKRWYPAGMTARRPSVSR